MSEVLRHLRDRWAVSSFTASVDTRNVRSVALLESLGFRRIGVHRAAEPVGGVLADEARYRLWTDEQGEYVPPGR